MTIPVKHGDGFTEMTEQDFPSEFELQRTLANNPNLLSADPDGVTRFVLVESEASVPDQTGNPARWSIDLVYREGEGLPAFSSIRTPPARCPSVTFRDSAGKRVNKAIQAPLDAPTGLQNEAFNLKIDRHSLLASLAQVGPQSEAAMAQRDCITDL